MVDLWQETPGSLLLSVLNPSGDPVDAVAAVSLDNPEAEDQRPFRFPIRIAEGQRVHSVALPMQMRGELPYPVQVTLHLSGATRSSLATSRPTRFAQAFDLTRMDTEGDPLDLKATEPEGGFAITRIAQPRGAELPVPGRAACVLAYDIPQAGDSAALLPVSVQHQRLLAQPAALGMWLYGDGSGNQVSVGLRDGSGTLHALGPVMLHGKQWQYVRFFVNEHWQGPFTLESLLRVERTAKGMAQGSVFINNPVWVYRF
jgi:hypothetical protein